MAVEGKTGIGQEGGYLRRVLSECLTDAVVELVLKRPADPIDFLAHYLYNYRTLHPLMKEEEIVRQSLTEETQHAACDVTPKVEVKMMTDNETFGLAGEISHDQNVQNVQNVIVHLSCRTAFDIIGDIFDDEDVT